MELTLIEERKKTREDRILLKAKAKAKLEMEEVEETETINMNRSIGSPSKSVAFR